MAAPAPEWHAVHRNPGIKTAPAQHASLALGQCRSSCRIASCRGRTGAAYAAALWPCQVQVQAMNFQQRQEVLSHQVQQGTSALQRPPPPAASS
jgi:hypothetical protein